MAKTGKGGGGKGGVGVGGGGKPVGGGGAGGKGGGAKGGGGKGKKGGGGGSGVVTMCLRQNDYTVITAAFNKAIKSTGSQGCEKGLMVVRLDFGTAQNLFTYLYTGIANAGTKKTKQGKGGKAKGKGGSLVGGSAKKKGAA